MSRAAVKAKVLEIISGAVSADCEVVNGWQAATTFGKVAVVGVPDDGSLSQPAWTAVVGERMGASNARESLVRVICQVEVPAGADDSSPASVEAEADATVDLIVAAVAARGAFGNVASHGWVDDLSCYLLDASSGWAAVIQFVINVELFV